MTDPGDPGTNGAPALPDVFSPVTRQWFAESFARPTAAQLGAWAAIASGNHTLVVAPTGSGKTLAAFLWAIDRLAQHPDRPRGTSVLYVSPLKALAIDIERNLRGPLAGIARIDPDAAGITVGVRTGDTDAAQRRRMLAHPPDVLITTPESLYLLLTSSARETLADVTTVIVDEVHAVAGGKRGSHLSLSLERLARIAPNAQRIGCSATVRPVEVVADFLTGGRPVEIVVAPADKVLDLSIAVPVEDLANPPATVTDDDENHGAPSVWPHVEQAVLDQIVAHTSTLVFTNSRRLAERLTSRLNELWVEQHGDVLADPVRVPAAVMAQSGQARGAPSVLARAHHGSVSKEVRRDIEDDLKSGRLRAVVATSSLELGIDMGAVDLVVQVQAPPGVASGLQRVGRAGHQVGAVSRAVVYPTHRGDLLAAAVTIDHMEAGDLEPVEPPRHPLDVLAQQVVAMTAVEEWDVDDLYAVVRRAWPYRDLPRSAYEAVLDMLAGRYPSEDFASLKPRVVWDRSANTVTARPGAQRIAVTNGGTIPDRGHFGVFLATGEGNTRVGELDEEMVYESRVGDVFALGSSSWRIEDITADRVIVTPAPGQAARLPFWKGDAVGRPAQLGQSLGEFLDAFDPAQPDVPGHLDPAAAANLVEYLTEQAQATGQLPGATRLVIEQFRDELGDRRVVLHSPFGARVHAPWALVLADRLEQRYGLDAQVMPADDGIVLRLPDDGSLDTLPDLLELLAVDPLDVHRELTRLIGGSALFASRFRECAARSLLFPRRDPSRRSPLWQQRQRSAQLLSVASGFDSFPVVLETVRECLQDVYDVPALTSLLRRIEAGEVSLVEVVTTSPSPFARSLLFGYVASFLYEGDSPLAERKSAALALDDALLTELLGTADLRDLLHPEAVADVAARLQRLGDRRAGTAEQSWDVLAQLGPLRADECADRGITPEFVTELGRRIFRFRHAGHEWLAVAEDAGRVRDGLGVALPPGLPEALLTPVPTAITDLAIRYARTHGPFPAAEFAERYAFPASVAHQTLDGLVTAGTLLGGAFQPGGTTTEYCHPDSLRAIRRASAARYRDEIEPVPQPAFAHFPPRWQHVGPQRRRRQRGRDGLLAVIEQLAGAPLPASQLEHPILSGRVDGYEPGLLDSLTTTGDVVWWGLGPLPKDGWVALAPADLAADLLPLSSVPDLPLDIALLAVLRDGGGWFADQLVARVTSDHEVTASDVDASLLRLLWSGQVGNDTLAPLRALTGGARVRRITNPTRRRARFAGRPQVRGTGRWTALPNADLPDPTRSLAVAEALLQRHGLVTRGVAQAERLTFGEVYRALAALEDRGACRRGYVVDGLGGAQFGLAAAVDLVRQGAEAPDDGELLVLAAADPANPFGAALPWPDPPGPARPGRKAGATVVLASGRPVLFVEKGGGSILAWDDPALGDAGAALVAAVHAGEVAPLAIKKVNGSRPAGAVADALAQAGGQVTPSGIRIRR